MSEGKNLKGTLFFIIGALLVVLALTADMIGIGASSGLGWKQGLVLIAGLAIAFVGKKCCLCCPEDSSKPEENKNPPPSDQV